MLVELFQLANEWVEGLGALMTDLVQHIRPQRLSAGSGRTSDVLR